jgi:predicted signal transduction protein with EAL and GGDEF domain
VSVGIGVYPVDGTDAETLLKHADMALFYAKAHGRSNHQFFKPNMNVRAVEREF